jgi:hypothetical protein
VVGRRRLGGRGVHRVPRPHEDIDVAIFRRDAERLRLALADRYTVWSVFDGALRPYGGAYPEVHPDADQLWLRPDARSPWHLEVLLNPDQDGRWVNRRLPSHSAPLDEVTWVRADGVRFLNPEVALLFKAKYRRAKDEHDLDAALPLLSGTQREWLAGMLERTLGADHAWARRLAAPNDQISHSGPAGDPPRRTLGGL